MVSPHTPTASFPPLGPFTTAAFTTQPTPRASPSANMRLAVAASDGDGRALDELLRSMAPKISRVVGTVLGRSHPDVEDATQQAMIGFARALPSFRGECEPVQFAARIAARAAIAAARRARDARARQDDAVELEYLASFDPEPFADVQRARRMAVMRAALGKIPPEQAETLALRIVLGWTVAEVSKAMMVPLNTVRSRMRLAKDALRSVIEKDPTLRAELSEELGA